MTQPLGCVRRQKRGETLVWVSAFAADLGEQWIDLATEFFNCCVPVTDHVFQTSQFEALGAGFGSHRLTTCVAGLPSAADAGVGGAGELAEVSIHVVHEQNNNRSGWTCQDPRNLRKNR